MTSYLESSNMNMLTAVPKRTKHFNSPILGLLAEKTKNAPFLVSLLSEGILNLEEDEGNGDIIFFDSTYSTRQCRNLLKRVYECSPYYMESKLKRIYYYSTRDFKPHARIPYIEAVLKMHPEIDGVYIDSLWSLMSKDRARYEMHYIQNKINEWTQVFDMKLRFEM